MDPSISSQITSQALARGLDPNLALAVANAESGGPLDGRCQPAQDPDVPDCGWYKDLGAFKMCGDVKAIWVVAIGSVVVGARGQVAECAEGKSL